MRGQKSIELVPSLLVTTSWSYPPDKYDEAKFYQRVHMTATMALEVGLGTKMGDSVRSTQPGELDAVKVTVTRCFGDSSVSTPMSAAPVETGIVEKGRAIVSSYIECSGYR